MQLEERSIVVRAEGCRLMYGAGVKAGGRSRRAEATMSIPINNGCTNGSASTKACKYTHTHTCAHPRTHRPTITHSLSLSHTHTHTHIYRNSLIHTYTRHINKPYSTKQI